MTPHLSTDLPQEPALNLTDIACLFALHPVPCAQVPSIMCVSRAQYTSIKHTRFTQYPSHTSPLLGRKNQSKCITPGDINRPSGTNTKTPRCARCVPLTCPGPSTLAAYPSPQRRHSVSQAPTARPSQRPRERRWTCGSHRSQDPTPAGHSRQHRQAMRCTYE